MAIPVDGPGLESHLTWGGTFGFVAWGRPWELSPPSIAEATTDGGSLLFTGGYNYVFGFYGDAYWPDDIVPFFWFNYGAGPEYGVSNEYMPQFIGKTIYPSAYDDDFFYKSHPPFPIPEELLTNNVFYVEPPYGDYIYVSWSSGIQTIEGFNDHITPP